MHGCDAAPSLRGEISRSCNTFQNSFTWRFANAHCWITLSPSKCRGASLLLIHRTQEPWAEVESCLPCANRPRAPTNLAAVAIVEQLTILGLAFLLQGSAATAVMPLCVGDCGPGRSAPIEAQPCCSDQRARGGHKGRVCIASCNSSPVGCGPLEGSHDSAFHGLHKMICLI
jgi:hypothetical protein